MRSGPGPGPGPLPSHEKFIANWQEAYSLPFPRVAPKSYQHTVSTVIHLAQCSPTPVRSFPERVKESNCQLTHCSRQLHHNPSARSHVNGFIFHAAFSPTIVDPHDSTPIPVTVLTETSPPSGPFLFKDSPKHFPSNITKSLSIIDDLP